MPNKTPHACCTPHPLLSDGDRWCSGGRTRDGEPPGYTGGLQKCRGLQQAASPCYLPRCTRRMHLSVYQVDYVDSIEVYGYPGRTVLTPKYSSVLVAPAVSYDTIILTILLLSAMLSCPSFCTGEYHPPPSCIQLTGRGAGIPTRTNPYTPILSGPPCAIFISLMLRPPLYWSVEISKIRGSNHAYAFLHSLGTRPTAMIDLCFE